MPTVNPELVEAFCAKAALVNAVVQELPNMEATLQYVVDVCEQKSPAEMLDDEPGTPSLDDADYAVLEKECQEKGFLCIKNGLRKYLAGIDVGLSFAEAGVAASGTCMVDNDNEDVRLAGMISEINIIVLKKSEIYPDLPSIADLLRKRMSSYLGTFTTLITGPSRTADIERVAAVGVHGPLELHIILLEDQHNA